MPRKKPRKFVNKKELNGAVNVSGESSSSESDSAITMRVTRSKSKIDFAQSTRSSRYNTRSKEPDLPLNACNKKKQLNKNTHKSTRQTKSLKVEKRSSRLQKDVEKTPTEQILETSLPVIESGMKFSGEIQIENSVSDFSYKTSTLVEGEESNSRKLVLPDCLNKSLQSKIMLNNIGIDENEGNAKNLLPVENNEGKNMDPNISNFLNEVIKCVSIDEEDRNALFSNNTNSDLLYDKQKNKLNNLKDEETGVEHNIIKLDRSCSTSSEMNIEDNEMNLNGDNTEKLDCNKSDKFRLSEEKSPLSEEPSLNVIKTHSKTAVEASTEDNIDELKKVNTASNLCDRSIIIQSSTSSIKVSDSPETLNIVINASDIFISEYEVDTPVLRADVTRTVENEREDKRFEKDNCVSDLLISKANEEHCSENLSKSKEDFTSEFKASAIPIIMSNQEGNIISLSSESMNDINIHGSGKSEVNSYVLVSNKHISDYYLQVEKESDKTFDKCGQFFSGLQDIKDYNSPHNNSMLSTSIAKDNTIEVPKKYGRCVELDKNNFHSPKSRKREMFSDDNTKSDAVLGELNGVQLENNTIINSNLEYNKNLENQVDAEHYTTNKGENNYIGFSHDEKIAIDVLSQAINCFESDCQKKQEFRGKFIVTEKSSDDNDQLEKPHNDINLEMNKIINPERKQSDVESTDINFAILKSNIDLSNFESNQDSATTEAKPDFHLHKEHSDKFSSLLENHSEISFNVVISPEKNNGILSTIQEKDTIKEKTLSENRLNSLQCDMKITEYKEGNDSIIELNDENVASSSSTELQKDTIFEETYSSSKLSSQKFETKELDATYTESGEKHKVLVSPIDQSEVNKSQKMIDSPTKSKFQESIIMKQDTFEKPDKMFNKSDFKNTDEKDKEELLKSEGTTIKISQEELAEKEIGTCLIRCSEMDEKTESHEKSKSLHFSQEIHIISKPSPDSSEFCKLYNTPEIEHCEVLSSGKEKNMLDSLELENRKIVSNELEKDENISLRSVIQNVNSTAETDCSMNLISLKEVTDCVSGDFCEKVNKFTLITNQNNLISESQKVINAELNLEPFVEEEQSSVLVEQVLFGNNLKLTSACQKDKKSSISEADLPKSELGERPEEDVTDCVIRFSNNNDGLTSEKKDNVICVSDENILIKDGNDHRSVNETVILEMHEKELKRENEFKVPNNPTDMQSLSLNRKTRKKHTQSVSGQENTVSTRSDVFPESSERNNCSLNLALETNTHKELSRDFHERGVKHKQKNVNQAKAISVKTGKRIKNYTFRPSHNSMSTSLKSDDKSKKSTSSRRRGISGCPSGSRNYRDSQKLDMNSSYLHVLNRICEEVQQEMANKLKEDNEIDWSVKVELLFLYDMINYKPVGVNRHFMMLLIHNKFSTHINHQISSKVLWDHLDTMYDMAALHESEIIPFPNDEVEFELPEDCHELLRTKCGVVLKRSNSENEANRNSASSKASKKLAPKLKQSSTPVGTPKSNFVSPVLYKPTKNQVSVKSESKTSNSDSSSKSKQELGLSTKMNKIKRSSSPFTGKTVKSESISVTKEDSPDISLNKKGNKIERGSSPATVKKTIKVDPNIANNSVKKPSKTEPSVNGSKPVKTETLDNSVKKIKVDVLNKKSKVVSSSEITSKKLKVDINGIKKKVDENAPKKTSESSSTKQIKTEVKTSSQPSKGTELESSASSGSRKSSPVVKMKSSDSSKKLKRPRVEESSKKLTPTPKRRRL